MFHQTIQLDHVDNNLVPIMTFMKLDFLLRTERM